MACEISFPIIMVFIPNIFLYYLLYLHIYFCLFLLISNLWEVFLLYHKETSFSFCLPCCHRFLLCLLRLKNRLLYHLTYLFFYATIAKIPLPEPIGKRDFDHIADHRHQWNIVNSVEQSASDSIHYRSKQC